LQYTPVNFDQREREEIEEGRDGEKVGEHVREERGVAY
jgi:hypothetical protein